MASDFLAHLPNTPLALLPSTYRLPALSFVSFEPSLLYFYFSTIYPRIIEEDEPSTLEVWIFEFEDLKATLPPVINQQIALAEYPTEKIVTRSLNVGEGPTLLRSPLHTRHSASCPDITSLVSTLAHLCSVGSIDPDVFAAYISEVVRG